MYQNAVPKNVVQPLFHAMFNNGHWVFKQDSTLPYKAHLKKHAKLAGNKFFLVLK